MGKILKKRFFVVFVIYFLVINAQSVFSQETDNREGLDDYIRQGWSHVEAGDLNKATASFQKGVELEPDNIKALEGLAWCYLYTDRLKKAAPKGSSGKKDAFSRADVSGRFMPSWATGRPCNGSGITPPVSPHAKMRLSIMSAGRFSSTATISSSRKSKPVN